MSDGVPYIIEKKVESFIRGFYAGSLFTSFLFLLAYLLAGA